MLDRKNRSPKTQKRIAGTRHEQTKAGRRSKRGEAKGCMPVFHLHTGPKYMERP